MTVGGLWSCHVDYEQTHDRQNVWTTVADLDTWPSDSDGHIRNHITRPNNKIIGKNYLHH